MNCPRPPAARSCDGCWFAPTTTRRGRLGLLPCLSCRQSASRGGAMVTTRRTTRPHSGASARRTPVRRTPPVKERTPPVKERNEPMTNNYLKAFTENGDRYLSAVADAQEQFLKYMKLT